MFSATFSKDIKKLAMGILHKPVQVEATPENTTVELLFKVYPCAKRKTELILNLLLKETGNRF
jgi:ATP-dependent RNA helicase RhlE